MTTFFSRALLARHGGLRSKRAPRLDDKTRRFHAQTFCLFAFGGSRSHLTLWRGTCYWQPTSRRVKLSRVNGGDRLFRLKVGPKSSSLTFQVYGHQCVVDQHIRRICRMALDVAYTFPSCRCGRGPSHRRRPFMTRERLATNKSAQPSGKALCTAGVTTLVCTIELKPGVVCIIDQSRRSTIAATRPSCRPPACHGTPPSLD